MHFLTNQGYSFGKVILYLMMLKKIIFWHNIDEQLEKDLKI